MATIAARVAGTSTGQAEKVSPLPRAGEGPGVRAADTLLIDRDCLQAAITEMRTRGARVCHE